MKRILAITVGVLTLASTGLAPTAAQGQMYGVTAAVPAGAFTFAGPHPVHPSFGGGFCYEAGRHTHPYSVDPNIAYLYRVSYEAYVFVGNVYEFGYNRQAFPYYNHHPLATEYGGTYCYIDGAHYHYFVPAQAYGANYIVHNGYYYYNGSYSPTYYSYRTDYYRPYYTYRYLPAYSTYATSYRTYATAYSKPASVSYIYSPPRTIYTAPPRVTIYNSPTPPTRFTPRSAPVYRYDANRPAAPSYARPATAYPVLRPAASTTTTTTTTKRVWRR